MSLRLFTPYPTTSKISITGDDAHYIATVMRAAIGAQITLMHPGGARHAAILRSVGKALVEVEITGELEPIAQPRVRITLAQGMLKGQKMDLVIQKATELGVSSIAPLVTERCQVRETRKVARWEKIASEAARQSLQPMAPSLHEPMEYKAFIDTLTSPGIIFWEESTTPINPALIPAEGEFIVIVGPEGGLTKTEVALAAAKHISVATLGPRILRAETASISTLSIVQYLCGAMG